MDGIQKCSGTRIRRGGLRRGSLREISEN
jgi:hypothetical protein